jgi:hypothetical protein
VPFLSTFMPHSARTSRFRAPVVGNFGDDNQN